MDLIRDFYDSLDLDDKTLLQLDVFTKENCNSIINVPKSCMKHCLLSYIAHNRHVIPDANLLFKYLLDKVNPVNISTYSIIIDAVLMERQYFDSEFLEITIHSEIINKDNVNQHPILTHALKMYFNSSIVKSILELGATIDADNRKKIQYMTIRNNILFPFIPNWTLNELSLLFLMRCAYCEFIEAETLLINYPNINVYIANKDHLSYRSSHNYPLYHIIKFDDDLDACRLFKRLMDNNVDLKHKYPHNQVLEITEEQINKMLNLIKNG